MLLPSTELEVKLRCFTTERKMVQVKERARWQYVDKTFLISSALTEALNHRRQWNGKNRANKNWNGGKQPESRDVFKELFLIETIPIKTEIKMKLIKSANLRWWFQIVREPQLNLFCLNVMLSINHTGTIISYNNINIISNHFTAGLRPLIEDEAFSFSLLRFTEK